MFRPGRTISLLAAAITFVVACGGSPAAAGLMPLEPTRQEHAAGDVHVEIAADSTSLRVSDSLQLTLRVTFPPTHRVQWPELSGKPDAPAKLGDFTIATLLDDAPLATGTPEAPRTTLTRRVTLEPFLPGTYTIPELAFGWRLIDGTAQGVIRTNPISITVQSLLPAPTSGDAQQPPSLDPGEIKPAMDPPATRRTSMLAMAIAAAIGGALTLALLLRRKKAEPDPLRDIEAVLASWPHDGSDRPEGQLADALVRCGRAALADRIDPIAAACFGPELHRILPATQGDPAAARLIEIVERLDQARFSGVAFAPDDRRQSLADVLAAVRSLRTKPRMGGGVGR